ncbi:MAG: hypothetical protein ACKOYC_06765, partial [Bacteroidota bacterium]
ERAYFNACKCLLSGSILFYKEKFSSGYEQLKQAIKIARNSDQLDVELLGLRALRRFAAFAGDEKLYYRFNSEIKIVEEKLQAEMQSEELNQELFLALARSVDLSEEWKGILELNFQKMKKLVASYDTILIKVNAYRLFVRYHQVNENYEAAIRVGLEHKEYLKGKTYRFIKNKFSEVSLNNLYNCLFLRDYQRGSIFAAECDELFDPGSINWLIFKEYHFLLCMHTSQFGKAASIFDQVLRHPSFGSYPPANMEKWKIFEAYLEYANPISTQVRRKFNVSKFLNEVPVFSKDKSGYNLTIILAQIILSVKTNEFHRVIDRAESLKVYLSRHVKKDNHARSYYFLKMLQVMIRYEFDAMKTAQIADKFLAKMKQSGIASPESSEVIPYEWLWTDLMLRLRESKFQNPQ